MFVFRITTQILLQSWFRKTFFPLGPHPILLSAIPCSHDRIKHISGRHFQESFYEIPLIMSEITVLPQGADLVRNCLLHFQLQDVTDGFC